MDLNGDGTSDAYRPKNLDTLRTQAQNARQNSLERAVVKEQVAQSDVWPPETHAALERQSPTSHQIIAEKNRNTSEILTHLYTRLIDNFQKHGFSQVDATNSAADFMRKYSEQLQQLLAVNTEPTVMREKIHDYLHEYRLSI